MSIAWMTRCVVVAVVVCAAAGVTEAKPRRIVILDVDGPSDLAERFRDALVDALREYELVAPNRWSDAQREAAERLTGPRVWRAAARATGADAVIEAWVQQVGQRIELSVVVRFARDGTELDILTITLPNDAISESAAQRLHDGLEERLEWIEPNEPAPPQPAPPPPPHPSGCYDLFGDCNSPPIPDAPTPRRRIGRIAGGFSIDQRRLTSSNATGLMQTSDSLRQGFLVAAELFPWSRDEARESGFGFALSIAGGAYQNDVLAAAHYRRLFGITALDIESGLSHHSVHVDSSEATHDSLHAGAHLALALTEQASLDAGARYFYSTAATGYSIDAGITVPLLQDVFVRGQTEYRRIASDSSATAAISMGLAF